MDAKTAKEVLSYANPSKGDYYWFLEKPSGGIARGGYADKSDIKERIQQWDADGYMDCKTGKFFSPEGTVFSNPKGGRSVSVAPEESRQENSLRNRSYFSEAKLVPVKGLRRVKLANADPQLKKKWETDPQYSDDPDVKFDEAWIWNGGGAIFGLAYKIPIGLARHGNDWTYGQDRNTAIGTLMRDLGLDFDGSSSANESEEVTLRDVNQILESMLAEVSKKNPKEVLNGKKGDWKTTKKTSRKIFFPDDKSGPIGGGLKFAKGKKKSKR